MSRHWSCAFVLVAAATALGGTDLRALNGDKITGAIEAGGEVDAFRVALPAGAVFSATAKAAKGGTALRVILTGPDSIALRDVQGTKASLAKLPIVTTGVHVLTVAASNGISAGAYSLTISWKPRTSFSASVDVLAGGASTLDFPAEAGTKATFLLKKGKGSAADPALIRVTGPAAFTQPLGPGTKSTATLPGFGAYTLQFGDGGSGGGGIAASVKLSPAKSAKRKLDLTSRVAPAGVVVLEAKLVGADGGTLTAPGTAIDGAAVTLPAGALSKPVVLLLGTATDVAPPSDPLLEPSGPAVFVGPEGQTFAAAATLTVPFDPADFPDGTAGLTVLTRDAAGVVTEVANPVIDPAGTVTVTTPHFSSYQVMFKANQATVVARIFNENASPSDHFGNIIGASDEWIAAALQPGNGSAERRAGIVYMYPFAGGLVGTPQVINNPDPHDFDNFGASFGIQGGVMVVGRSRGSPTNVENGTARVYTLSGNAWGLDQTLRQRGTDANVEFGVSVALDGDRMVVGSCWLDFAGTSAPTSAAAYVFRFDGTDWVEEARLVPGVAADAKSFGRTVAISGTTVAVGAPDFFAPYSTVGKKGSVTVFARDPGSGTWSQTDRFEGNGSEKLYGWSLGLAGDVLVVGAPDFQGPTEGRALVYEGAPGSMSFVEKLTGQGTLNANFGISCDLKGDLLVIGASGQLNGYPGKAYGYHRRSGVFKRTGTLRGQDVGIEDPGWLGTRVSIAGPYFVAGAPNAPGGVNANVLQGGAVFVALPE